MSEMIKHIHALSGLLRKAETQRDVERRDGRNGHAADREKEAAALRAAIDAMWPRPAS